MKNFKILIILLALISAAVFLSGCLDAPVVPEGIIKGIVYDKNGYPISRAFVSIGDFPIARSNYSGSFSFDQAQIPYNLTVGYTGETGAKYLGLHTPICNVYNTSYDYSYPLFVKISFPPWDHNRIVFIKFISDGKFLQSRVQLDILSDTTWSTVINISRSMGINRGKFLYLEASTLDGVHIDTYLKYGIKEADLNIYPFPEIHFNPEDITNIPGQSVQNFKIIMPEELVNYGTDCYVSFNGMDKGSDLHLDYASIGNSGIFQVPIIDGLDYKFKIVSSYFNVPSVSGALGVTWQYANFGEDVTLTHDIPVKLVKPSNGQKNITDATVFQIYDPGQKGIYFYRFIMGIHSLTIITDQTSIHFSDVKSRLADFGPNTEYFWYVLKYPKYTSIDNFVSVKYTEDDRYNSIPCSQSFLFTTAP